MALLIIDAWNQSSGYPQSKVAISHWLTSRAAISTAPQSVCTGAIISLRTMAEPMVASSGSMCNEQRRAERTDACGQDECGETAPSTGSAIFSQKA